MDFSMYPFRSSKCLFIALRLSSLFCMGGADRYQPNTGAYSCEKG